MWRVVGAASWRVSPNPLQIWLGTDSTYTRFGNPRVHSFIAADVAFLADVAFGD